LLLEESTRIERFEAITDSTAEGVLIGIPGLPSQAPFRSVGLAHFDGKGNLTWLEHTVVNGTLLEADWPAAPIASMQIAPEAQW
jgi:hypothetical protein